MQLPWATRLLIGIVGRKEEAQAIEGKIRAFLTTELHLRIAEDKSSLKHFREGHLFLGHLLRSRSTARRRRTWREGATKQQEANQLELFGSTKKPRIRTTVKSYQERIELSIPPAKIEAFCHSKGYGRYWDAKPVSRPALTSRSVLEIVTTFNAELRGFANFYCLCPRAKSELRKLGYLSLYSLMKTLAHKHKERKAAWFRRLKRGTEYYYKYEVQGKPREVRIFQIKHLKVKHVNWSTTDVVPNTKGLTMGRTELLRRLNAATCEYCGSTDKLEVHHVKKVKDLQGKPLWEKMMIAMKRKQLVLCFTCHRQLHAGKLPNVRATRK